MSAAISRSSAAATLTEIRRAYRAELTAAVKHNPGSASYQMRQIAGDATLRRIVRALERHVPESEWQPLDRSEGPELRPLINQIDRLDRTGSIKGRKHRGRK